MCGSCNNGTQHRLLLQVNLTFDEAIEVALAVEAADNAREISYPWFEELFPLLAGEKRSTS